MKKNLFSLLIPIFFLVPGSALAAPVFGIHETVHHFEPVPEGKRVYHSFIFRNEGDKELKILKVETGCGCTAASYTKRLLPGEEGTIDVALDTLGYADMDVIQPIRLTTNDPGRKTVELQFRGAVTRFARVEPAFIRLQGVEGDDIETNLQIYPCPDYPFTIEAFHAREGKDFRFEVFSEEDGKVYHIKARNVRETAGRYFDLITLEIDSPIRESISIRVLGDIRARDTTP